MAIKLYTCGTVSNRRPWIRGPPSIPGAVIINAKILPNPYKYVSSDHEETRLDEVEDFLRRVCEQKFENLVAKGVHAIDCGKSVIVQCLFGRDRSHAVARVIQRRCGTKITSITLIDA